MKRSATALVLLLLGTTAATAADQEILGRKLLVSEPTSPSGKRVVVVQGKERPTSVTSTGAVQTLGATLHVIANGGSPSTQSFTLTAGGWSMYGASALYRGLTTSDPVRRVVLKTSQSSAMLKAVLRSSAGIVVTPPNPGSDGGIVLEVGGGDRYCVSLGGAAGGAEVVDDATRWKIIAATAKPGCPVSSIPTTTSTSSTSSTTLLVTCGTSAPACDGTCPPSYHCESVGDTCFCFTGGSGPCTTCDVPCTGSDVCTGAVETAPPYLAHCGCATPPVCNTGVCGGSCPAGSSCVDINPPTASCNCYIF